MKRFLLLLLFPFALWVALILVWEGRKYRMNPPRGGINYAGVLEYGDHVMDEKGQCRTV